LEVEGGVHLLTGYPGSPVAGFFDVLGDISKLLKDHGVLGYNQEGWPQLRRVLFTTRVTL